MLLKHLTQNYYYSIAQNPLEYDVIELGTIREKKAALHLENFVSTLQKDYILNGYKNKTKADYQILKDNLQKITAMSLENRKPALALKGYILLKQCEMIFCQNKDEEKLCDCFYENEKEIENFFVDHASDKISLFYQIQAQTDKELTREITGEEASAIGAILMRPSV